MKYKAEEPNTNEHALITAVTSAFRAINPSYENAHTWYTQNVILKQDISPISRSVKSKYYIPLFGSVFASALAFVMILTSQNSAFPTENLAFNAKSDSVSQEMADVAPFSTMSAKMTQTQSEEKHVLAKIDAQSKATSRTQADESFTESLNTETSLQDLFE